MKKIIFGIVFLALAVGVGWMTQGTWRPFLQGNNQAILRIVFNTDATDLSPEGLDLNNTTRSANIYEGLVAFDRHLRIVPALALSWGNLTPTTWEFKLRRGVVFHDAASFNAKSVVERFTEAKGKMSQLTPTLKTIKTIRAMDDYTLQIETETPDPLLLSKLTKFYIARPNKIGTGPYQFKEWREGDTLLLTAFPDYWGEEPFFSEVEYKVIPNKVERDQEFSKGAIDILGSVLKIQALELPANQLKTSFSLEVNFLLFPFKNPVFADKALRQALQKSFDPGQIEVIGNQAVRRVSQFVAPGVYGYNDSIPLITFEEEKRARNLFDNRLLSLDFYYPETYTILAEYLNQQLQDAGFALKRHPVSPETLVSELRANPSALFMVGWQAEDGDAGGFLETFIHSDGEFNRGRYQNPEVDRLIEESRQEMDPKKRLALLQAIMLKIHEDVIGIPLFESSRLYAVKKGLSWEPRLDGLILGVDAR